MLAIAALVLLQAMAGHPGRAEPCTGGAERTVFGFWGTVPAADSRLDAGHRTQTLAARPTTRYFRVLIDVEEPGGPAWTLTIRDIDQHVLQTLGAANIDDSGTMLTRRLPAHTLRFELTATDDRFPRLSLRQQIVMPFAVEGQPYYSRKQPGVDDWSGLYESTVSAARRRWGDNVGFLMIGLREGSQPATCSGIALPPDLMLTNWHCGPRFNNAGEELVDAFWSPSLCDRTLVDLSWDDDGISREFACGSVLAKSRDFDYALLRLRAIDGSPAIAPVPISLRTDAAVVSLVHHPAASQKVISPTCQIVDHALPSRIDNVSGAGFAHRCDSERGSSGAPMFTTAGELIGLHHVGFEKLPATGNCDNRNKAIWMKTILSDLGRKVAAVEDKVTASDLAAITSLVVR